MAEDAWREGRQAWRRLSKWVRFDDGPNPRDGAGALAALGDVGLARRLLDRAGDGHVVAGAWGRGFGVREPRRPVPGSSPGTKQRDEITDEAV